MLTFRLNYLLAFILLFFIEVIIALYFHDRFVRAFVGDVLVVVLIYSFLRIFLKSRKKNVAIGVFIFAIVIEILQHFKLVEILGLEQIKMAKIILGSTFDWTDLLAYLIGFVGILMFDRKSPH